MDFFSGSITTNGKNSMDDVSSIVGDGSRRSLLDTSVTSAATTTVSPQSIQNDDARSDVTCVSPQPDVLRIYVPYDTPTKNSPTSSISNKITTIQVMDEMATPTVETDGMFKVVSTIN